MKIPRLLFTLLVATLSLYPSLHAADDSSQLAASESNPYSLKKVVSYYRATGSSSPSIEIDGQLSQHSNNYHFCVGRPLAGTTLSPDAAISFAHNDLLRVSIFNFLPPTQEGWTQDYEKWTWESSQPNVLYCIGMDYLDDGAIVLDELHSGHCTPYPYSSMYYYFVANPSSESGYMADSNFTPIVKNAGGMDVGIQYHFQTGAFFMAGTPGTTTLTLSHFANFTDTTPDHTFSFTITVPEESLEVKKDSHEFLPVGSDS